jgi:hypothetical protein
MLDLPTGFTDCQVMGSVAKAISRRSTFSTTWQEAFAVQSCFSKRGDYTMKFAMTKIAAALALTLTATGAHAAAVTGMTLADAIDGAGTSSYADDTLGTDGRSGAFRFGIISLSNYFGVSPFTGDVNGGAIDVTQAKPVGSFTTGFYFTSFPFEPYTSGAIDMDITGGVLTVNSLPWGAYRNANGLSQLPDAGTLVVHNLIQTGADTYAYRMGWSHIITTTEDPSGGYVGFNARWMLEGTMTTAVPEPETYAMMVAGLGLVGAAARRRRKPA